MRPRSRHYQMAPVTDTCPTINRAQKAIQDAIDFLESIDWGDDEESRDLESAAKKHIDGLSEAHHGALEDVRKANEKLREWGAETEANLEEAKEQNEELERQMERQAA